MKRVLRIFQHYSNALLIFITITILIVLLNVSSRGYERASEDIIFLMEVYAMTVEDGSEQNLQPALEKLEKVIGQMYFGPLEKEMDHSIADLRAAELRQSLLNILELYQIVLSDRRNAMSVLYTFLVVGIFIQFVFLVINLERRRDSELKFAASENRFLELQNARENERQRIASFLHDSVLQELGALLMYPEFPENSEARSMLQETISNIRHSAYQLSPLELTSLGLEGSVRDMAETFAAIENISVDFRVNGFKEELLDENSRLVFFRIVQEGLNNIKKHAKATKVVIKLVASHPYIVISISDNGIGFSLPKKDSSSRHLGLNLMKHKARSIGADFSISSGEKGGTYIKLKYRTKKEESR